MVDTLLAMSVIPMAIFGRRAWAADIGQFRSAVAPRSGSSRCSVSP